jgi:F-type H+-transporting ATPase subunit b
VNYLPTQFGAEASGIGALGVDGKAFLIQLITFVLAFLVIKKYAFGPIIKIMEQRRQTIESGVTLGEVMKKKQAELDKQVTAALAEARKEADGILASADDAARARAAETEAKARKKADGILKEADDRIEQDIVRARKKLESELVSLVSDATEAIIDEKVDAKKDAALIEKALKGSRS